MRSDFHPLFQETLSCDTDSEVPQDDSEVWGVLGKLNRDHTSLLPCLHRHPQFFHNPALPKALPGKGSRRPSVMSIKLHSPGFRGVGATGRQAVDKNFFRTRIRDDFCL
jgi:hypothetical protein